MSYLNLKPVEFSALGKKTQAAFKWEGRILLPKYDGCFAMVAFYNGKPDYIMSRTGEVVKSMDHIFDDLQIKYPWLGEQRGQGGIMVLGEAWTEGYEFSDLSGMFRRQRPVLDLGFAPFDIVRYRHEGEDDLPTLWSEDTYSLRLGTLEDARNVRCKVYAPVSTVCSGHDMAIAYSQRCKERGGFDGAVCSDPHAKYQPGAGKGGEFIKLKPLLSYSLQVVDVLKTIGDKTGRVVGIPVVRFQGKECGVGTGMTAAEAAVWYANPSTILGKIIEVEAMGVSSKGLLREPRFKGVRTDVTKADY